ncbi:signal recognition particle subunit SRP72 [Ischnura elegans]|uniref:signal recognition particle subunit SRP72 n=1 Tax=Ischnura elegans TaxID=197161 RepID=UPI001ED88325|nr:signal recognition particle subunit SRP72 [Ischnura elegans]
MASAKESKITFLYGELNRLGHNGEYERAIKTANKILHDNPDEVKAFHCKIVSLIHLSKFQDGLNFISKNTKLSSGLVFEKAYCQYRLNQPQEALKTINNVAALTLKLKELKSQILYRLERYEECLDVYRDIIKNSSDEYEDERETNLAAVVANLSFSNSKVLHDVPPPRDHTYELAYNGACRLLGECKWLETEGKLREAERLCRETLEEDGASEEDVDEELAIIRIQRAYCLQAQGRGKEAQALYNSVLQSTRKPRSGEGEGESIAPPSGLDPSLLAVASNNLVAFNRDGNVFDSKKRMRAATAEGLEHRLTSRQQACIALNNCLLAFYTNQTDQCKQLCGKLAQEHPELATDAVLVEASALAREGKAGAGVALLRSTKAKDEGARLALQLATAQLLLAQGNVSEACSVLLGLGGETTFRPGVVSALVALCLASGDRSGASNVLKQAVEWYRKNKAEGGDLRMLWRHAADFHLRGGDAAVAARSLEELLRLDPKDTKTMAQLVIAFSQFDPKKAQSLSRQLPAVMDDAIDVDVLETSNWTMGSKVIKKTVGGGKDSVPSPKPMTAGEELLVKASKRPRRRRKGKLPKNYDPESTPDPERWLPRHERTGFRKKKDRRAKDVGKGTQGAASGGSDQYDITKMQTTGGASPSMRHGSPGEPGPRQQQRKGQQQKKKRKGAKW